MSISQCGSSYGRSIGMDRFSLTMYWEESNFVLAACLRGFGEDQVRVQCSNRRVHLIAGESLSCCWFTQTVQLPENVNAEETVTLIHDGMLTVTVPIAVRRRPKRRSPAAIAGVSGLRCHRFLC